MTLIVFFGILQKYMCCDNVTIGIKQRAIGRIRLAVRGLQASGGGATKVLSWLVNHIKARYPKKSFVIPL